MQQRQTVLLGRLGDCAIWRGKAGSATGSARSGLSTVIFPRGGFAIPRARDNTDARLEHDYLPGVASPCARRAKTHGIFLCVPHAFRGSVEAEGNGNRQMESQSEHRHADRAEACGAFRALNSIVF